MKRNKTICLKIHLSGDNPNLNEDVWRFNLELSSLLTLYDNDMINDDLNDTLLQ